MQFRNLLLVAALVCPTVPVSATAFAEGKEKVVKLDQIPAAARRTILKEANGAPVLKVEIEEKNGRSLYEAHIKQGKDEIGILVDAKGALIGKHSEKDEKNEK